MENILIILIGTCTKKLKKKNVSLLWNVSSGTDKRITSVCIYINMCKDAVSDNLYRYRSH